MAARRGQTPGRGVDAEATYSLKISTQRARNVYRTAEFSGANTFADVHDFIQHAFELDDDHMFAFFLTNKAWDNKDVIASQPSYAWERDAADARLGDGSLTGRKRLLYLFDFGDELRHDIEVVDVGRVEPGVEYPRILDSRGDAPPQYESDELDDAPPLAADLEPLAAEVLAAAAAHDERQEQWDEDDAPKRELADLMLDVGVARRLLAALDGRPEQLAAIEATGEVFVGDWLLDLPFDLVECGAPDAAVELAQSIHARLGDEISQAENILARILAKTGRTDEARAIGERFLAIGRQDDDLDAVDDAADLFALLGDDERAESLTREILRSRGALDVTTEGAAHHRLIELLRKRGADDEADDLAAELPRDDLESSDERPLVDAQAIFAAAAKMLAAPAPVPKPVIAPVKIGRNDPCSCGSGKKFKKCCG